MQKTRLKNRIKQMLALSIAMLVVLSMFTACSAQSSTTVINNVKDINGKRIGILVGTLFEDTAYEDFPSSSITFYNTYADLIQALKSGKIDTFLCDDATARALCDLDYKITFLPQLITNEKYGPIFRRSEGGEKLCEKFNRFIYNYSERGDLSLLQGKWLNAGKSGRDTFYKFQDLPDVNGKIRIAAVNDTEPFSFVSFGLLTGYEVGLMYDFCKEFGFAAEIVSTDIDDVFSGVSVGKYDIGVGLLSYTDERNERFIFATPDYEGGAVAVVLTTVAEESNGFFGSIVNGFDKTFVREGRWQMFLDGIGVTLLISCVSAILGTIIGFALYTLGVYLRNKNKAFLKFLDLYVLFVKRMPIVVFLMISYYAVFGNTNISGLVISIIAFTFTFAATVIDLFHSTVSKVDNGQFKAALSLGYTEMQAYNKFLLPQATKAIANDYKESIIGLVQATSVVGYISVEDLTKISDLVRSRSYESVFPLVATALIYFFIAWILTLIIRNIEFVFDEKKRTPDKILKGVDKR